MRRAWWGLGGLAGGGPSGAWGAAATSPPRLAAAMSAEVFRQVDSVFLALHRMRLRQVRWGGGSGVLSASSGW